MGIFIFSKHVTKYIAGLCSSTTYVTKHTFLHLNIVTFNAISYHTKFTVTYNNVPRVTYNESLYYIDFE